MIKFKQIYFIKIKGNIFRYQVQRHNGVTWRNTGYEQEVKCAVAIGTCHPATQLKLATGTDNWVHRNLAENRNLLPELQHKLAADANVYVRNWLAKNPNLIPEVQHILAADTNVYVRYNLAANPKLLPELKRKIKYEI